MHRHGQQEPRLAGAQHTHIGHTRLGCGLNSIRPSAVRKKEKDSRKENWEGWIVNSKRLAYHLDVLELLDMGGLERRPKQLQERKGG